MSVAIDQLPGELYQVVLLKTQDGRVLSSERPHPKHVWGQVKFDFEQVCADFVFPKGLE